EGKKKGKLLKGILNSWVRLLAPFIPYTCEEVWQKSGGEGFVSNASWPEINEGLVNREAELSEELIKSTVQDIENILGVTGKKPSTIFLYTTPSWKWKVYEAASKVKKPDMKAVMGKVMQDDELRKMGKEVSKYVGEIVRDPSRLRFEIKIDEFKALKEAEVFLKEEFGSKIEVNLAKAGVHDPMNKMNQATPMKPAIYIE
ncbi:MAG: class I tRNA ligase family protein, partial [Desulfatiglandales bacterium]